MADRPIAELKKHAEQRGLKNDGTRDDLLLALRPYSKVRTVGKLRSLCESGQSCRAPIYATRYCSPRFRKGSTRERRVFSEKQQFRGLFGSSAASCGLLVLSRLPCRSPVRDLSTARKPCPRGVYVPAQQSHVCVREAEGSALHSLRFLGSFKFLVTYSLIEECSFGFYWFSGSAAVRTRAYSYVPRTTSIIRERKLLASHIVVLLCCSRRHHLRSPSTAVVTRQAPMPSLVILEWKNSKEPRKSRSYISCMRNREEKNKQPAAYVHIGV